MTQEPVRENPYTALKELVDGMSAMLSDVLDPAEKAKSPVIEEGWFGALWSARKRLDFASENLSEKAELAQSMDQLMQAGLVKPRG